MAEGRRLTKVRLADFLRGLKTLIGKAPRPRRQINRSLIPSPPPPAPNRGRALPYHGRGLVLLERADTRRTSFRCRRNHSGPRLPRDPHDFQLLEGLPHPDEAAPSPRGIDDDAGKSRLELLPQLVAHRLL